MGSLPGDPAELVTGSWQRLSTRKDWLHRLLFGQGHVQLEEASRRAQGPGRADFCAVAAPRDAQPTAAVASWWLSPQTSPAPSRTGSGGSHIALHFPGWCGQIHQPPLTVLKRRSRLFLLSWP